MSRPVLVVVGAGPGIGAALARSCATDGYDVGLVGRHAEMLAHLVGELVAMGVDAAAEVADIADVEGCSAAVRSLGERWGRIDHLHFNPSAFRQQDPLRLSVAALLEDVALGVGALLTAVQAARPFLSSGARITATGSMAADEPWHEAASLGVQKAGLRNLVRSIDATLAPEGIRAVSVTVRGTLAAEGTFSPERVAQALRAAAGQDAGQGVGQDVGEWRTEVAHPAD